MTGVTYVVAFDGQELSVAALERAREYADGMDQQLVAVTVVPENESYARDRGWLDPGEGFDFGRVAERLADRVESVAPEATFRAEGVDRYAPPGTVASRIRQVARDLDADVMFVGSDNAGGFAAPVTSVGGAVSSPATYDVFLVRHSGVRGSGGGRASD